MNMEETRALRRVLYFKKTRNKLHPQRKMNRFSQHFNLLISIYIVGFSIYKNTLGLTGEVIVTYLQLARKLNTCY